MTGEFRSADQCANGVSANSTKEADTFPKKTGNIFECVKKLAGFSLELQLRKDENLNKLAAQTMTAITILSVAFLTPSQLLFSYYSFGSIEITGCQRLLATAYIVLLFLLVASFLLALASRLPRKSEMLDAPGTIFNDFANQVTNVQKAGEKLSDKDLADYYCASISPFFETTRKKNEQAWRLIKMSICLLSFTALLASLFLAIAFVGYIS